MANNFGTDILLQSPDPRGAAQFYVDHLGFAITSEAPMMELRGENLNLYIDAGPTLGPVLEVFVSSVEETRDRLMANGCTVVAEDPTVPRCYVCDPFGLVYNLAQRK